MLLFQSADFLLEILKESAGMGAIHLCMMKLEGNRKLIAEQLSAVFAPDDKRIIENTAVHADCAINFRVNDS